MERAYWVGSLPNVGYVIYDPSIQDDESDQVLLFSVQTQELRSYGRSDTRGKIEPESSETEIARCSELYQAWRERFYSTSEGPARTDNAGLQNHLETAIADQIEKHFRDHFQHTQDRLTAREAEIDSLKSQISSLTSEVEAKNAALMNARLQIGELEHRNRALDIETLDLLSRQAALYAAGGNEDFKSILSSVKLDGKLPLVLANHLEARLRKSLHQLDPVYKLFDLIKQAKEKDVLDDPAVDMAHIIRKQRNRIAHDSYTDQEATAQILITLYAAAILWPRLPKW